MPGQSVRERLAAKLRDKLRALYPGKASSNNSTNNNNKNSGYQSGDGSDSFDSDDRGDFDASDDDEFGGGGGGDDDYGSDEDEGTSGYRYVAHPSLFVRFCLSPHLFLSLFSLPLTLLINHDASARRRA
jgi:hypothetical protein